MCTYQPSLQQSHNSISQGQQIFANFSRFTNDRMRVANRGQSAVSFPSIGSDFAVKLNTFFDRGNQAGPEASLTLWRRIRPARPSRTSTATRTSVLPAAPRLRLPGCDPPT